MPVSFKYYVDITSGVGAGVNVGQRQLIARLFDDNPLIPTNSQVDFNSANEVINYFGANTIEALRAEQYFGWVSKEITQPRQISFARWNSAASAPQIFGARGAQSLISWQAITSGSFVLTMGASVFTLSGLDFSSAASLADVASIIQTAIRAETGGGALWTSAVVAWDATRQQFTLTGGVTGPAAIHVAAGSGGSDIAGQLGWLSALAVLSAGAAIQSITDVLTTSASANNNFGSFAFTATLTQDQIVEAATWNNAQNVMFMYSVPVTASTASAIQAAVAGIGGITLTLDPQISGEYPEMIPMMILAATDYNQANGTQNYMFQQFDLTPSVATDSAAQTYDNLRINYYAQTQTAGQLINLYQRGVMLGLAVDPADQNVYANEIWLKDAMGASIMTLLLALTKVSANAQGVAQITSIVQGVISQALLNGTISVGKILSPVQQAFITQLTNDPLAWKQVQNIGYWLDVVIVPLSVNGVTQYEIQYTLIYSKDDVIRKVIGSDILI